MQAGSPGRYRPPGVDSWYSGASDRQVSRVSTEIYAPGCAGSAARGSAFQACGGFGERLRLRPTRLANTVSKRSARRLHEALRESLVLAIANRGSSVDTYRDAWGDVGGQQERLLVYGRAGEPCFNCGRPLSSVRIAGRTTVFCRRCQR